MRSNNIKIGVLGGIGPEASAYFYTKLVNDFQNFYKPKQNSDYPQIILNSIPAPELISSGKIGYEDLAPYKKGIRELNKHNPDFIVMVCNTIHLFHNELQQISKSKILNLKNLILKRVEELPQKNVCVLGTPNTVKEKLFFSKKKIFSDLSESDCLLMSNLVNKYNLGINKEKQKILFNRFLKQKKSKGEIIVLGCTELALMNKAADKNIISTLDVMVAETLKHLKFF